MRHADSSVGTVTSRQMGWHSISKDSGVRTVYIYIYIYTHTKKARCRQLEQFCVSFLLLHVRYYTHSPNATAVS